MPHDLLADENDRVRVGCDARPARSRAGGSRSAGALRCQSPCQSTRGAVAGLRRDAQRHRAEGGRRRAESDRRVLLEPARGNARAQDEALAFLAHETVADHQDPLGGGPDVLAVAHAAAAGARMDRLRPLAGRRGQGRDRIHQLEVARVAGAQQHLGDVQGQVGVDAGMDHVLEERAVHETAARAGTRRNRAGADRPAHTVAADSRTASEPMAPASRRR